MTNEKSTKIASIGLGYAGLPLAVEFGKKIHVLYDIKYLLEEDQVDGRL